MSATDELHRMLTEAGIEYRFNNATKVFEWHFDGTNGEGSAHATEVNGGVNIIACSLTPEQAIAATVGRDDRESYDAGFASGVKATLQQLYGLLHEYPTLDDIEAWADSQWEEYE